MPLAAGTKVGAYQIIALIGKGGMGEVYRARDAALGRDVAIKILPDAWLAHPDRRARFDREARVLASFSHPNIGAIFGLEDAGNVPALILELVEGETLEDRLAKSAAPQTTGLPFREALNIALQIADALDAAHDRSIVHRDLKPANIKITADGLVKVLDFGLAKTAPLGLAEPNLTNSPTFATGGSESGVILGTAAYMSPEQARGQPVDKRADIWAFGCVLYEMLTGRSPFARDTVTDVLVAILDREPDSSMLPPTVPASVSRLLQRCLTKDPRQRLRDIGDARLEIADALALSGSAAPVPPEQRARHAPRPLPWIIAGAAVVTATAVIVWTLAMRPRATSTGPAPVARLVIATPAADPLAIDQPMVAISADGRRIAYVAGRGRRQRIFLRDIDQFESVTLAGTEGGNGPFFSADGQWLGFIADGSLKKLSVAGGQPQSITDMTQTKGSTAFAVASWESDDTIFFTPTVGAGIWRVSAAGGQPSAVTNLAEGENAHRSPQLLPGGKVLLFSAASGSTTQAFAQILATGQRRRLVNGSGARYLPTGHLVYLESDKLLTVPFDLERLEVTGSPVSVLTGIMQIARLRNSTVNNFTPQVAFSNAGTLAYIPAASRPQRSALVWVDRNGVEQATGASGGRYFQPRLSPDGRRIAIVVGGESRDDVWIYDLSREAWNRFTSESNNAFPVWTPDGRRLTYVSDKAGPDNMYWKPLDGSGAEERFVVSNRANYCFSWSRDGRLAYVSVQPRTLQDIWIVRPDQRDKPTAVLETPFGEGAPQFSPDGRWLAYVSNETGRNEVYVRAFPGPGERLTISTEGGNEVVWSRDGRELFYRSGDAMMAVSVMPGAVLNVGRPRKLFEKQYEPTLALWPNYDVSLDGQRFLMVKTVEQEAAPTQINVVLNWAEELKRLAPGVRPR